MTRTAYLDGLRGWAALAVVLYHFVDGLRPAFLHPGGSPIIGSGDFSVGAFARAVFGFAFDGRLAVAIFFILSGIVLSGAVSRALEHPEASDQRARPTLAGLMLKRYFRLSLPMLGSTLLGYFAFLCFTGADFRRLATLAPPMHLSWTARLIDCGPCLSPSIGGALREGLLGYKPFYNQVLWTIPVEFIGSFLVFSLVFGIRRVQLRRFLAVIALLLCEGSYFGAFFVGVLIFEFAPVLRRRTENRPRASLLMDSVGIFLACLGLLGSGLVQGFPLIGRIVEAGAHMIAIVHWVSSPALTRAVLVTIGCTLSPRLQRLLSASISVFLGRISFSLYLIHSPILMILVFPLYIHFVGQAADPSLTTLALALAAAPVLLGFSVPYYMYVERPSIALAKYIGALTDRLQANNLQLLLRFKRWAWPQP